MKKSSLNVLGLGSLAFSVLIGSGCAYKIPEVSPVKPQLTETSPTIETRVSSDGRVRFYKRNDVSVFEGYFESPSLKEGGISPNEGKGIVEYHKNHPEFGKLIHIETQFGFGKAIVEDGIFGEPDGKPDRIIYGKEDIRIKDREELSGAKRRFYNNMSDVVYDLSAYIFQEFGEHPLEE